MQPPEIDLSRFNQMFLDEAAEILHVLEGGLLELNTDTFDSEHYNAIFRAAHSLKGNAGMTGWETIADFTHVIEEILDELRTQRRQLDAELSKHLLTAVDHLKQMLSKPQTAPLSESARLCLSQLSETRLVSNDHPNQTTTTVAQAKYKITWTPPVDCMKRGVDPLLILSSLKDLGTIETISCDFSHLPPLRQLDPHESHLTWTIELQTGAPLSDIQDIFSFQAVEDKLSIEARATSTQHQPPPQTVITQPVAPQPAPKPTDTIRVAANKLDAIFNLVGEMVITQSMAIQAIETNAERLPELDATLQDLKRQTRELQDRVMSLRLVPVDHVFRRFPRLVHDLSQQLGKNIDLQISGADTEIDRAIVDQIGDPLIHLIRNCADHGIEPAETRKTRGKPGIGTIHLTARCQGGHTIVELNDDGSGIDTERIRTKALQRNLIQPNIKYTDKQLQSLIFHPGFSTAETVTPISGRGVGMDAVRRSIEALSGSIAVNSVPGKGSQFTIHLPMTMAILDGLLITIAGNFLVLPLASITECIRVKPGQLRTIPTDTAAKNKEILVNRDNILPVLRMDHLFENIRNHNTEPHSQRLAILIEHNGTQFAILADEILGKSQVVIKSLETNYRRIEGLQGATILGDGRVALVVDLAALTRIQERLEEQTLNGIKQTTQLPFAEIHHETVQSRH